MSQERVRSSFVTAADVAERAGVSRSAVSRTFTPGASVSREARARFLDAARLDRGRHVPDDLSVVGFDDIPQASWCAYQLTTFRQPVRMLTDQVMQIIRERAATPESPRAVFTLPAALVVRGTVRGLAAPDGST